MEIDRVEAVEFESLNSMLLGLALSPYRHPEIDIPEGTLTTDAYLHDIFVTIYRKQQN